jgi:esterase/lipase superfamily enzyme
MNPPAYLDHRTAGMKESSHWYSPRLDMNTSLVRYGHFGVPLLLFPTAGGDCEEAERFFLIKQLEPFIHDGRLKVYSVDSIAGRTWLTEDRVAHCVWIQKQFDNYIRHEVVPAIYQDCRSDQLAILTAGASIGAFNALLTLCRHPEVFSHALCLSGTYDIAKWLKGEWYDDFHHLAPLHFVPGLPDGDQLTRLRSRKVILATGKGRNEEPGQSWQVAHVLGQKGIPNRVDVWDESWPHDWITWRAMLPQYIQEVLISIENGSI